MQSTTTGPVTRRHNFFPKFPFIKTKIERARDNRTPQQQQQCNNTSHKILKTDSESFTITSIAGSKDKTWPQCGADPVASPYNNQSSAGQGKKKNKKRPKRKKKQYHCLQAPNQHQRRWDLEIRWGDYYQLVPPAKQKGGRDEKNNAKKMREKKNRGNGDEN